MFSRVVGAGLALIAAAVLAAVLAAPRLVPAELSLFAGHPTVNGRLRTSQEVYVGLYEARLCNRGGDGTCKSGNATQAFRITAYAGLATTGILIIGSVALALVALTKSERRKRAVRVVRLAGVATLGAAAALLALGPFDEASVPIGTTGVALYGGGVLAALLASVLVRPPPPIRLRVADRPSQPLMTMAQPAAPAFDPSMFASDPPPRSRRDSRGQPPEPFVVDGAGASPEQPLFSTGQQLRPLYEASPMQRGPGGMVGMDRPASSPMPHALVSASTGLPLPASESAWAEPSWAAPPPPEPPVPPVPAWAEAWAEARPDAPPPPPPRTRSASTAPPSLPGMTPSRPQAAAPPFGDLSARGPADAYDPTLANGHGNAERFSTTGTDQSLFANLETPLAEPPSRDAPSPRARVETPLAPPPPPVAPSWAHNAAGFAPPFDPRAFGHGFDASAQYHASLETVRFEPPAPTERFEPPAPTEQLALAMIESLEAQASDRAPADPLGGPTTLVAATPPAPPAPGEIAPPMSAMPIASPMTTSASPAPIEAALAPEAPSVAAPLPPPPPGAPARAQRDTLQPRPAPETLAPRPVLRAAVPMPARTAPSSARIPAPATRPPPVPPPRRPAGATAPPMIPRIPAIPMTIPPIPPIAAGAPSPSAPVIVAPPSAASVAIASVPTIPAVPALAPRPQTGDGDADRPGDAPTAANIPIEITDNNSQTNVSVDIPLSEAGETGESLAAPEAGDAAPEAVAATSSSSHSRSSPKLPISTAPESLPPPAEGKLASGPVPACPQCESPMAWVEEHLRFYCKSCRMYF